MTWRIRAHFDGNVIIPDEHVDLPVNQPLEAEVTALQGSEPGVSSALIEDRMQRLARATGCLSGPAIPDEAMRRENIYG